MSGGPQFQDVQPRPCHLCGGGGRISGSSCLACRGSGRLYLNIGHWWYQRRLQKGHLQAVKAAPVQEI